MNRWLISLLLFCLVQIWGGIHLLDQALAEELPESTTLEIVQGEKIAKKAFRASERGDFAKAETYWTTLVENFPNNPAVWSNRGNVRIGQYKLAEAIADFDRSIEIAPEYPDAYLNRGIAYEGKKLWDKAIADYNHVLQINPQDPVALNNRGNAKAGQKKWIEALEDYQLAADLAPTFPLARGNASLIQYQIGDRSEALRNMRNLVRKYPMYSDMRAALAAVLWVEGKQGEAESNWVAAIGLDNRYQDLDWLENIRRWPPSMTEALERFLSLN
ncbi:MAG: tetratricopeptide repeat protein [Cyanobacteria bacterium P01_G01_bin.67]